MKTVRISVTKQDIKKGDPQLTESCPVALAIRRATGQHVSVTNSFFIFDDDAKVSLPKRVERFVDRFDEGKAVRPFRFTLRVPEERHP